MAEHVDHGLYTSNAVTRPWPSFDDLMEWVNENPTYTTEIDTNNPESHQWALDAAISRIAQRTQRNIWKRQTTAVYVDGVATYPTITDPARILEEVEPEIFLATLMYAARLIDRKTTTNGVLGSSEIAGIMRVSSIDPDIEALIGNYRRIGLA